MFQQHFGLKHIPFGKNSTFCINDQFTRLKEQFMSLLHSPGVGLLTGEPGVGKTAALRHIIKDLNPHQYSIFYLSETQFTSFDVYRQIAVILGLVPPNRFANLWREIKNQIRDRVDNKRALPIFIIYLDALLKDFLKSIYLIVFFLSIFLFFSSPFSQISRWPSGKNKIIYIVIKSE